MTTRRQWHLSALSAIVGAALLAACGGRGNDKELNVTSVVSFGDSLSDLGTYTIVTSQVVGVAPFFGGRFTTNTHTGYTPTTSPLSNTATIWVEWVASRVSVPITQAMLGIATTRIPCPVAGALPALASSCTAYGQGGSRVTVPASSTAGALQDPVVTQVAAHLARFTSFSSGDIVFVWAGGNDFLTQFSAVGAAVIAPATAVANMQIAATELATLIKSQIAGKGATRIAVLNLADTAGLPAINGLPASSKALATQLSTEFNNTLSSGLAGTTGVAIIDMGVLFADVIASPAKYGMTDVTGFACDPAKMAPATGGSSLFCNATAGAAFNTIKTGASASKWFFADGVHPTTGGHKVIADYVISQIKALGWIPPNL